MEVYVIKNTNYYWLVEVKIRTLVIKVADLSLGGEGNGTPLQCSCLENPREGEPGGLPSLGSHKVRHD